MHLAYEHISVHTGFDFFRRNPPAAVELGFINWSFRSLPSTETTTTTTTTTIFCQSQSHVSSGVNDFEFNNRVGRILILFDRNQYNVDMVCKNTSYVWSSYAVQNNNI
jgi:hypothetical protein